MHRLFSTEGGAVCVNVRIPFLADEHRRQEFEDESHLRVHAYASSALI